MPNVKDIKVNAQKQRRIVLAVGANKSGKTCGLVTHPGKGKIYNFDGPGRMQPIVHMWRDMDIEYDNVGPKKIDHPDPDKSSLGIVEFAKEFEGLQDNCPYDWVLLDSFTSFSTTAVTFQLLARMGGSYSLKNIKLTKGGLPIASWDEFNGETSLIAMVLDVAKILPCTVMMTAHPILKQDVDPDSGRVIRRYSKIAAYGNKVDQIVPGYFTEIWRFERETNNDPALPPVTYRVYTIPAPDQHLASTAMPLPSVMDITNKKLWEVIDKELDKDRRQEQTARDLNLNLVKK